MTQWFHSHPTARTVHHCESCGRTIAPGEEYDRVFAVDSGDHWTYKECVHCHALVQIWQLWEFASDEGYGADTFNEYYLYERRTEADSIYWTQWKRRWRHDDGTLYPIPTRQEALAS